MEEKEILKKETIELSRKEIPGLVSYLVSSLIAILLVNNHNFINQRRARLFQMMSIQWYICRKKTVFKF